MKSLLFLVPVAALYASAALAAPMGGAGYQQLEAPMLMSDTQVRKANALYAWHEEGLKLRTADGGKLTPEHLKYLQLKLLAIRAGNY